MKRKGFTLIELLAVIIILSIISLIAVPQVLNIISNSKENSDKINIDLFLKSFEDELYSLGINDIESDIKYCTVNDGIATCDGKILFDSKSNIFGYVYLENNEINRYLLKSNDFTYSEGFTDEKCFKYEVNDNEIILFDYLSIKKNANCSRDVIIPPIIDGKVVISIDNGTFFKSNLTSVVIPDSVTTIGEQAFMKNYLTSVVIPDSVTTIGSSAFEDNLLANVTLSNNLTGISSRTFYGNMLKFIKIPSSVTRIEEDAFSFGENNFYTKASIIIDAHEGDVYIHTWAFSNKSSDSICWLKDNPTCSN